MKPNILRTNEDADITNETKIFNYLMEFIQYYV